MANPPWFLPRAGHPGSAASCPGRPCSAGEGCWSSWRWAAPPPYRTASSPTPTGSRSSPGARGGNGVGAGHQHPYAWVLFEYHNHGVGGTTRQPHHSHTCAARLENCLSVTLKTPHFTICCLSYKPLAERFPEAKAENAQHSDARHWSHRFYGPSSCRATTLRSRQQDNEITNSRTTDFVKLLRAVSGKWKMSPNGGNPLSLKMVFKRKKKKKKKDLKRTSPVVSCLLGKERLAVYCPFGRRGWQPLCCKYQDKYCLLSKHNPTSTGLPKAAGTREASGWLGNPHQRTSSMKGSPLFLCLFSTMCWMNLMLTAGNRIFHFGPCRVSMSVTEIRSGFTAIKANIQARDPIRTLSILSYPHSLHKVKVNRKISSIANSFLSVKRTLAQCHEQNKCLCGQKSTEKFKQILANYEALDVTSAAIKSLGELDILLDWMEKSP
ncbi:interleukin-20 [Patagioenas fasciata monilis]|uniref:Interleukin-20 n=1 Tax=Patagioenas fasciata monilis TaxID=372326 RepID=A0A1V4KXF3_PATFA|nr:interleukin-20 [Patagioenas fasciata monilis]